MVFLEGLVKILGAMIDRAPLPGRTFKPIVRWLAPDRIVDPDIALVNARAREYTAKDSSSLANERFALLDFIFPQGLSYQEKLRSHWPYGRGIA
jgi:hypothetical protein